MVPHISCPGNVTQPRVTLAKSSVPSRVKFEGILLSKVMNIDSDQIQEQNRKTWQVLQVTPLSGVLKSDCADRIRGCLTSLTTKQSQEKIPIISTL